jgi:hypothetical protein
VCGASTVQVQHLNSSQDRWPACTRSAEDHKCISYLPSSGHKSAGLLGTQYFTHSKAEQTDLAICSTVALATSAV